MPQFRDALGGFIDTGNDNYHAKKSSSQDPWPRIASNSPSGSTGAGTGTGVASVIIQGGGTFFAFLSNPA